MKIREATIDDVVHFDRIRRDCLPWHVATVAAQRNWFSSLPPEARSQRLVAEIDGQVVGFASGGFNFFTAEEGAGSCMVTVEHARRGQGVGSALYDLIEAHLREIGAKRTQVYAIEEPGGLEWAERRGWTQGARARFSKVDTSQLPPMPPTPAGVSVVSVASLGPEEVYKVDVAGSVGEPGDVTYDGGSYDLWLRRMWGSPDMHKDASMVAVVDGVPAALTVAEINLATGRSWSGGTCTLPEYRGRGLSKLVKSASLRKAAELGVTTAITANDYTNGPMLAVNTWLGYEVFASERSILKTFS